MGSPGETGPNLDLPGVDWLSAPTELTAFLRDRGFALTVADDLRVVALEQRLDKAGVVIKDAKAAARWLGPVLCRSADQRLRLYDLLVQWARTRMALPQLEPEPPRVDPAVEPAVQLVRKDAGWQTGLVVAGVLLLACLIFASYLAGAAGSNPDIWPRVGEQTWTSSGILAQFTNIPISEIASRAPLGLGAFLVTGLFVVWRRGRRHALLRGLVPADAPKAAVALARGTMPVFALDTIRTALRDMRRHRRIPTGEIDVKASVRATVLAGGFVHLVQGHRPIAPDHLLLVDRARYDDHITLLADLLVDRLKSEQVPVTRYDYHGDPRCLRQIGDDGSVCDTVDLEELRVIAGGSRLLLLADTEGFVDSHTGFARRWVDGLSEWSTVVLLTPLPAANWGPRERDLMRRGFLVVEATPDGLRDLAQQMQSDLSADRASPAGPEPLALDETLAVDPFLWIGDEAPPPGRVGKLIRELREALGRDGFHYLAALAVFPTLHPELTLLVGTAVLDEQGQALLNERRLGSLCRLPWLRHGRMPDWLRLALVRALEEELEAADRVRAAWTALLQPVREVNAASILIPMVPQPDPAVRNLIGNLIRSGRAPDMQEAILLAFLERVPLPELAVELPHRLDSLMRRRIDTVEVLAVGLALLAAIGGFFLGPIPLEPLWNALLRAVSALPAGNVMATIERVLPQELLRSAPIAMTLGALGLWAAVATLGTWSSVRPALSPLVVSIPVALARLLGGMATGLASVNLLANPGWEASLSLGAVLAGFVWALFVPAGAPPPRVDGHSLRDLFTGNVWWIKASELFVTFSFTAIIVGSGHNFNTLGFSSSLTDKISLFLAYRVGSFACSALVILPFRVRLGLQRTDCFAFAAAFMCGIWVFDGAWLSFQPRPSEASVELALHAGSIAASLILWRKGLVRFLTLARLWSVVVLLAVLQYSGEDINPVANTPLNELPPLMVGLAVVLGLDRRARFLLLGIAFAISLASNGRTLSLLVPAIKVDDNLVVYAARNLVDLTVLSFPDPVYFGFAYWAVPTALVWPALRICCPGLWREEVSIR